jgi:hypothetical protein
MVGFEVSFLGPIPQPAVATGRVSCSNRAKRDAVSRRGSRRWTRVLPRRGTHDGIVSVLHSLTTQRTVSAFDLRLPLLRPLPFVQMRRRFAASVSGCGEVRLLCERAFWIALGIVFFLIDCQAACWHGISMPMKPSPSLPKLLATRF